MKYVKQKHALARLYMPSISFESNRQQGEDGRKGIGSQRIYPQNGLVT